MAVGTPWIVVACIVTFLWLVSTANLWLLITTPYTMLGNITPDKLHDFLGAAGFCALNVWNVFHFIHHKMML